MDVVRELFREYAATVGSAICFQAFERELASLPGHYSVLLLATEGSALAGCAAMRRLEGHICEMKRLYVRPAFQGTGIGRRMVEKIIAEARSGGYQLLRLDTLPAMERAIALYRTLGFRPIPPYGDNPAEALCFELSL